MTTTRALTSTTRHHKTGLLPFVIGNLLLGTIGVFVHQAQTDALTATWFRCAFGGLALTIWLYWNGRLHCLWPAREALPWVIATGSLMVMAWGLFFFAIERIPTGVAVVLFHVQPLWVMLFAAIWLKTPLGLSRVLLLIATILGLTLATGILEHAAVGDIKQVFGLAEWLGVLACLIGAFCTASVTIVADRLREIPVGIIAWWQCIIGALALCAWPIWPDWGSTWGWLASLGLIHTGLAYTLIYLGMTRLNTSRIIILQFVYPAVAVLIDWQYFNQSMSLLQGGGLALISAAIGGAELTAGHKTA
ncbi:MAG: EamA family transporter [Rhodocyclaceae bacterium]